MEFIKTIWNLFVFVTCLSFFGSMAGVTYKLGMSALDLHQKGLFCLAKYNRMLVEPTKWEH